MTGNVKIDSVSRKKDSKLVSRADQEAVSPHPQQTVEQAILLALKGIRFGSVEIIVHDSKVVQIERKEKTRFNRPSSRSVARSGNGDSESFHG